MTRRSRWLTGMLSALAMALVGGAIVVCLPALRGDAEAPVLDRGDAERAVAAARREDAARWARESLEAAEARFKTADLEQRRQAVRPWPLRDFSSARAHLGDARVLALHARAEALRNRRESHEHTAAALSRATLLIEETRKMVGSLRIDASARRRLSAAETRLREARLLAAGGDDEGAREGARLATESAVDVRRSVVAQSARYRDPQELKAWQAWKRATIETSRRSGGTAILVDKDDRRLTLYSAGRAVASYTVELGENSLARKLREGDGATPEGRYKITAKKGLGQSQYHRALALDYPNRDDLHRLERMKKAGELPAHAGPGSLIEIHGNGGKGRDWTRGCVALSDHDIDELFHRVGVGTPVTIIGSDGDGDFTRLGRVLERGLDDRLRGD